MEQSEKAKMFFEFSIEYYPNSPMHMIPMAEYYETNNDYTSALKFVTRAYELSKSDCHVQRMKDLQEKNK